MNLLKSTSIRPIRCQTHPPIPQQLGSVTFNAAEVATAASADAESYVGKDLAKQNDGHDYLRCLLCGGFPDQLRLLMVATQRLCPWLRRRQTCGLERAGRRCLAVLPCSSLCAFWFENAVSPIGDGGKSLRVLWWYASTEQGIAVRGGGWRRCCLCIYVASWEVQFSISSCLTV